MADHTLTAPAEPGDRIESIDVVRGFALLGILAMNVSVFAAPFAAYQNPTVVFPFEGLNRYTFWIVHTLFDLKMMSIFSMLFGAGVVMWDEKTRRRWNPGAACRACGAPFAGSAPEHCPVCDRRTDVPPLSFGTGLWLRRMLWLLVIGLIHAYLIWEGDILVAYAVTGIVLVWWVRRFSAQALFLIGILMLFPPALVSLGTGYWATINEFPIAARGFGVPQNAITSMTSGYEDFLANSAPSAEQIAESKAIYRGTWLELAMHRWFMAAWIQFLVYPLYIFWRAGSMMLIGAALYKLGILNGRRSTGFFLTLAIVCYAVGLPLVFGGIVFNEQTEFNPGLFNLLGIQFNTIGSIPVAIAHICLLQWLVKIGALGLVGRALAAVGRMALTNYLMQSIICSIIFYGFAIGLHGTLDRFQQQLIVIAIWIAQLIWSPIWLARFRFGPAEWLWRSLTYWRRQPMRRA